MNLVSHIFLSASGPAYYPFKNTHDLNVKAMALDFMKTKDAKAHHVLNRLFNDPIRIEEKLFQTLQSRLDNQLPKMSVLAMFLDLDMTADEYKKFKAFLDTVGYPILPCYDVMDEFKKLQLPEDLQNKYTVMNESELILPMKVSVLYNLEALLETEVVKDILKNMPLNSVLTYVASCGADGSTGQSQYMQKSAVGVNQKGLFASEMSYVALLSKDDGQYSKMAHVNPLGMSSYSIAPLRYVYPLSKQ